MARPRKGDEVRRTISVRLDPRVVEAIDAAAKRAGVTRSAYIEAALTAELSMLNSISPSPDVVLGVAAPRFHTEEADDVAVCRHPKGKRTVYQWGTMCECGARV